MNKMRLLSEKGIESDQEKTKEQGSCSINTANIKE